MAKGEYYVYVLRREDLTPFYIGMGKKDRWLNHEKRARLGDRNYRCNIIRKMWTRGVQLRKDKLAERLTKDEAANLEKCLILIIGRFPHGPLVNHTDGGDGCSGYRPSQETREKISRAQIGRRRTFTAEHLAALSEAAKRRVLANPEEWKRTAAKSLGGSSEAAKAKNRKWHTGLTQSEETRAKRSESLKRAYAEGRR